MILDQQEEFFKWTGKYDENQLTGFFSYDNIDIIDAGRFEKGL